LCPDPLSDRVKVGDLAVKGVAGRVCESFREPAAELVVEVDVIAEL
jgi:hypothetical protein